MDELEQRVRDSLAAQASRLAPAPRPAHDVVRQGREARSRRTAVSALVGAVAAVGLATTAVLVVPGSGDDAPLVVATSGPSTAPSGRAVDGHPTTSQALLAALPQGPPPVVPLVIGDAIVSEDGPVGLGGEALAAAAWRDGVLVVLRSAGGDQLWRWDAVARSLQRIEGEHVVGAVVVDADGTRAGYVVRRPEGSGTRLHRVVRVIPGDQAALGVAGGPRVSPAPVGGAPGAPEGPPVGFVADELVLGVAGPEGGDGRVEAWDHERGTTRVVGPGRYRAALATHPSGVVALTRSADSCHEVSELAASPGWWSSCDAVPLSFSPDGQLLLVAAEALSVVAARTGSVARALQLPMGGYASSGWESRTAVLVLLRTEAGGVQPVRCRVDVDGCERAGPELARNADLPAVVGARPATG